MQSAEKSIVAFFVLGFIGVKHIFPCFLVNDAIGFSAFILLFTFNYSIVSRLPVFFIGKHGLNILT